MEFRVPKEFIGTETVVDSNFARQLETEIHHWRKDYRKLATLHSKQIGDVAKEISRLKLKLLYHGITH